VTKKVDNFLLGKRKKINLAKVKTLEIEPYVEKNVHREYDFDLGSLCDKPISATKRIRANARIG